MSPKPWYNKGLRFSCTRCGNCCTTHGEYAWVYLGEAEVEALAAHLGLATEDFRARFCTRDGEWTCLRMDSPRCPFLTEERTCAVHPVRPVQCATWPFWWDNLARERWEGEVSRTCPGIGRGPLHSREEIERRADENEAAAEA